MGKTTRSKAASATVAVSPLVADSAGVGYSFGSNRRVAADHIKACSKLPEGQKQDAYNAFKDGCIVAYMENPPHKKQAAAQQYVARRWNNMDHKARLEAAAAMRAKAGPDTGKADRRTVLEHEAVRAADTRLSELKRYAGLTAERKGGPKKRKEETAKPDNAPTAIYATQTFSNDNDAREFFGNVAAMLLATVNVNEQPKAPKSVKGVTFKVASLVSDFKKAIDAALKD